MNGATIFIGASTLVQTHAVAALVLRLLSAPLARSHRALTCVTTRDFVVAVSPSVTSRPLSSVCMSSHTHALRRRYLTRRNTYNREGNCAKKNTSFSYYLTN